jgi:hypothetical protein
MLMVDTYATWRVVHSQRQRAIAKNRYFSKFKFQNFVDVERSGFHWGVEWRYFCGLVPTTAHSTVDTSQNFRVLFHAWCCGPNLGALIGAI